MNQQPTVRSLRHVCAALLMGVSASAALAQSDLPGQPPYSNPSVPEAPLPSRPAEDFKNAGATTKVSRASERILANISMLSGEAVRLSQVASQRAASSQVRSYADQVNSSARALEHEVDSLAINKNVTVPTGKKANELAEDSERWQRKAADNFDDDFVKRTVKLHEESIEELEDYLDRDRNDTDPEISALAQKHLPSLRENLRQAEALRRQLD